MASACAIRQLLLFDHSPNLITTHALTLTSLDKLMNDKPKSISLKRNEPPTDEEISIGAQQDQDGTTQLWNEDETTCQPKQIVEDGIFSDEESNSGEFEDNQLSEEDEDEEDESADDKSEDESPYEASEYGDDDIVFDDDEEAHQTKGIETPFWFANEDKEQIREIMSKYSNELKLEEEKSRCIRQPPPFIGRIKRIKVENDNTFTTFDLVDIYRRSLVPPGTEMPSIRSVYFLTTWSSDDGVPIRFLQLSTKALKKFWESRIIHDTPPSYLLSLPAYNSPKDQYEYQVSSLELKVGYSQSSQMNINYYEIPSHLKGSQDEQESEADLMKRLSAPIN